MQEQQRAWEAQQQQLAQQQVQEDEDADLARALAMSLEESTADSDDWLASAETDVKTKAGQQGQVQSRES